MGYHLNLKIDAGKTIGHGMPDSLNRADCENIFENIPGQSLLNKESALAAATELRNSLFNSQTAGDFGKGMQTEQVRLLYRALPSTIAASALFALILASVLWPAIAEERVVAWLTALATVLMAKAALAVAWRRSSATAESFAPAWLFRFRAAIIAAGMGWGAGATLLFPPSDALHQVFLAFVVAGVSVGVITLLAVDRVSVLGFLGLILMPLAIRFGMEGDRISLFMAVMIALYLIFVVASARRVGLGFQENVRLRIEAGERERILRMRNQELTSVVESSPDNIIRYGLDCRAVYVNHMMEKTVNVTAISLIGRTPVESRFEGLEGVENYQAKLEQVIETGVPETVEVQVRHPSGNLHTHHVRFVAERDSDGKIVGALAFGRDVTESKLAEAELRIAATAFDTKEGMMITDANAVILRVNRGFTDITGYTSEEAVGNRPNLLSSGRHDGNFYAAMWESLYHTGAWQGEIWNRRKSGEIYPENLSITAVRRADGMITNYVATLEDVTQRKVTDEKIKYLAFYDSLTQLPNRRLLLDRLQHALATSIRSGRRGALLFIDLDNFKTLNDTLGHNKGDLLLQQVAQRLVTCVREADTVARLGDDEFVVILENMSDQPREAAAEAEITGKNILDTLSQSYQLDGCECHSTQSIGITLFGGLQQSMDELMKQADLAMVRAKASGRNGLLFFDPEMQAMVTARAALEADFRRAMHKNQILLHYQPQIDRNGGMTGAEALVRWHHPDRGMVLPGDFVPLAEEIGLILPIGLWVLQTACTQLAKWSARAETAHLIMSVNVSARQLLHPDFVDQVLAALDESGANPGQLKLELTESLLVDNVEDTIIKMTALKAKGISFSLDDFGTGYSSLSYLKRLPLDQLKIDQSFVRDILSDPNDAAIARTIVTLAQSLGLSVIAEGVETEPQRDLLSRYGCHNYQGYLFSRPLSADQLDAFVVKKGS
jgi:diguanylate cyclase (GGDEF)-like protein/PAS domain S-box-containing protein